MDFCESLLLLFLLFVTYYFIFVAQKARIYSSNRAQLEFLDKLKTLKEVYYPTFFYFNGILQSIFGLSKRLPTSRLPYIREIFRLKDGGEVGLDFLEPIVTPDPKNLTATFKDKKVLVIILPGLTSSSQTSYVKTLVISAATAGAKVIVINNRGLGGVPLKTPRTFCASNCEDVQEIMKYLHEKFPNYSKIAIGASLGGIVLSHYLTKFQEEAKQVLKSAVLISIVWNAHTATACIEKRVTRYFVNYGLADSLKALIKKHRAVLEPHWDIESILKNSRTLREFDSNFTAPQFKYKSVKEYYDDVTVSSRIQHFPIPVYGLSAADDPMQVLPTLPLKEAQMKGSNLALIVTKRGGHLGFLEGFLPISKPMHFMERFIHEFLLHMTQDIAGTSKSST